jgi:lactate permease
MDFSLLENGTSMGTWTQNYDPLGNAWLSTVAAAVPVCLLFYLLAVRKIRAHLAAVYSFVAAILIAGLVFGMPWTMVSGAASAGIVFGIVRIAWTLIAAVFVYEMTVETGHFETIKASIGGITDDRRLQVLLVAFAFGALLEGAGGGGAPVAITGAMMVGMGFPPFEAAVVSLVANTAPVAWGGAGNPIRTLHAVTDLPTADLSATIGRILPWTALILPFWLIRSQVNWRRTFEVWPGALACGIFFACIQFGWSNYVEESLVDVMGGMLTLLFLAFFYRWWKPAQLYRYPVDPPVEALRKQRHRRSEILLAWSPFLLLSAFVVVWGLPAVKSVLVQFDLSIAVPGLNQMVMREPPVVAEPHLEGAFYDRPVLALDGRDGDLSGRAGVGSARWSLRRQDDESDGPDAEPAALQPGRDCGDAGAGLYHPLFGHGCRDGSRHDQYWGVVSAVWDADWLARRRSDRYRRRLQRPVRQPPGHHSQQAGAESGADGGRQLGRGRDGEDDRRAVHYRRLRGGEPGGQGRRCLPRRAGP